MKFLDLFEADAYYLSFGHHANSEAWQMVDNGDIQRRKVDANGHCTLHHDWAWGDTIGGRIDHDKKVVTMSFRVDNSEGADYAERILRMDFPGYRIIRFPEDL